MVARWRFEAFTSLVAFRRSSDVGVCTFTPSGGAGVATSSLGGAGVATSSLGGGGVATSALARLLSGGVGGLAADFAAVAFSPFGWTGTSAGAGGSGDDSFASVNAGDACLASWGFLAIFLFLSFFFLATGFDFFGSESLGAVMVLRIRCWGVLHPKDSASKACSSSDAVASWVSASPANTRSIAWA